MALQHPSHVKGDANGWVRGSYDDVSGSTATNVPTNATALASFITFTFIRIHSSAAAVDGSSAKTANASHRVGSNMSGSILRLRRVALVPRADSAMRDEDPCRLTGPSRRHDGTLGPQLKRATLECPTTGHVVQRRCRAEKCVALQIVEQCCGNHVVRKPTDAAALGGTLGSGSD